MMNSCRRQLMYLFGKGNYGQIATILTLIIAAIFVFVVITLNMRRVTQKKMVLDNAADGAALFLASNLGSLGNKIAHEYLGVDDEGKPKTENCNRDWSLIANIGILIASILVTIFTWGAGAGTIIAAIAKIAQTTVALTAFGLFGQVANIMVIEPKQFDNFSLYFKQMTAEQQLIEGAIQYALFSAADDAAEVIDVNDEDGDGFKNDKILRLTQAYYERLRSLPSLGTIIGEFVTHLRNLVVTEENPETWEMKKVYIPDPWAFEGRPFINYLKEDFIPLLQSLKDSGYPVSFWQPGGVETEEEGNDGVDQLAVDIADFGSWAKSVLEGAPDERLVSFDQWYSPLIHPENPEDDWQERLIEWQSHLDKWIAELNEIQSRVEECVKGCCATDAGGTNKCCCELCGTEYSPGECCNTCCRIQFNCDRLTSQIVSALDHYLTPFEQKVRDFSNYLPNFESQVNTFRVNLSKSLSYAYEWTDTLGSHRVNVSVDDLPADFKGPYLAQKRKWLGFEKCTELKNYAGDFKVVVSRYDKEEPSGLKGILNLLSWNRTITSEAKAHYGVNKEDIKIKMAR